MAEFLSDDETKDIFNLEENNISNNNNDEASIKKENVSLKLMNDFETILKYLFISLNIDKVVDVKRSKSIIINSKELRKESLNISYINSIKINEEGYLLTHINLKMARKLVSYMLTNSFNTGENDDLKPLSVIESSLIKKLDYRIIARLNELFSMLLPTKLSLDKTTNYFNDIGYMGLDCEYYLVSYSILLDGEADLMSFYFPKHLLNKYINKFDKMGA